MLEKYSEYKEINTSWLHSIPKNWVSVKIGELFEERKVKVSDKKYAPLTVGKMGVVPQLSTVAKSNDSDNRKLVKSGDYVINSRSDRKGSSGLSSLDGSVSLINIVLNPREGNGKYYHYLLRSYYWIEEYYRNGRGIVADLWTTRFSEMKSIVLPIPPRSEQEQIVRYLDWKVSMINKYINAKKKQIDLLREQKQAVINRTIMQDGKGWDYKPLKYWAKSNLFSLSSNTDSNYRLEYLDISSIGHGFVKRNPMHYTFENAPLRARRIVHYGDTIISTVRTYLRSVCFINHDIEHCIVSTGFSVLTPKKNIVLPELLSFVLSTDHFINKTISNSIGVSYPAINDNKLMSFKVALPRSLEKQELLYSFIKEQSQIFDDVIQSIQKQISFLQEYRTRLISDVVTGRVNVQNIKVLEFIEDDQESQEIIEKEDDE